MNSTQTTIAQSVHLVGIGLHTGTTVEMTLAPATAGSGIMFRRTDLPDEPMVKANHLHADESNRGTNLRIGDQFIHTVEHFLAACAGAGIDNLLVTLCGPELPAMDGSPQPFLDALLGCGLKDLGTPSTVYRLKETATYADEHGTLTVMPSTTFKVSYTLQYKNPLIGYQYKELVIDTHTLREELLSARTFCLHSEVEALRKAGLGLGGGLHNAVVVGDDAILNEGGLRFPDEFVRHKMVDLIGDLGLVGGIVKGHFVGIRSGHVHNVRLIKQLFARNLLVKDQAEADYVDVRRICEIIPHRFPFLLVDRLLELEVGKRAVGLKNVSVNEPFFQGHFPGQPVMPGVLMVEALAQVAGVCILSMPEHMGRTPFFTGLDNIKFRRPIVPGDQVRMEIEVKKIKGVMGYVAARALVEGKVAVEGILKFTVL